MRVMFAVYPAHAHLHPVVPCAWALQNAGHEVCIASFTGFSGPIAAAGLTPVALGEPGSVEARFAEGAELPKAGEELTRYADIMELSPAERSSWEIFYQFMLLACGDYLKLDRPEVADIMAFTRSWRPDLVIWDPTFPVAALAARACGAAHARFLAGPDIFAWHLERLAANRSKLAAAGLEPNPLGALMLPVAERYGIELDDELLLGHWSIDPFPDDLRLQTGTQRVPVRYVPYAGAAALPEWLYSTPDRPRVVLSLGISTRQAMSGSHVRDEPSYSTFSPGGGPGDNGQLDSGNIFRMSAEQERIAMFLDAVADLDIEVVATLNEIQRNGLPTIPGNVRTIDYAPLPQLLSTSSAVAHHGGLGTTATASVLSVPQLIFDTGGSNQIVTVTHDDGSVELVLPDKKLEATYMADYVIMHRAGVRLNHKMQTSSDMRSLLSQVLGDPSYTEGAASVRRDWQQHPSPGEIVPVLEKLVIQHRSGSRLASARR